MNIAVDGNNFFHTGWLARFLGLPKECPAAESLKQEDVVAFIDGWKMCDETPADGTPNRLTAFYGMAKLGQASVLWVNDDNEAMTLP